MELELLCSSHYSRFVYKKSAHLKKLIQKMNPGRDQLSVCLFIVCLGTSEPLDVAEILLQYGADPDYIVDKFGGYSAFHHVCRNGDLKKAKLLYKHGANLDLQSTRGESPIYLAKTSDSIDVLEFLLENDAETELFPR